MAIHWQVKFKTLRGGKVLTASVYDNTYDGQPIQLKGGAEPFVTEESNDDDPFKAIRTQTGSLKIVDDGYALDGVTPFNWRDLQPRSDHDRPVILTDENDTILWQGFLQAQNFSGTLYEATQEREFPLQCALSILSSQYPNTTDQGIVNFAYLLNYISSMVSAASLSVINFSEFIIQGGEDAQTWLMSMFHWSNLLSEDSEANVAPQYDLFTCLEDMCNFWGWSARTCGTKLYLLCQEDPVEQEALILTPAELATLATGTPVGTWEPDPFVRRDLTGNIFASNDNDDMWMNGPSKVSVKSDCNEQSTVVTFAPPTVQKQMDDAGSYSWVPGTEQNTGYYTTPYIQTFDSNVLKGSALLNGAGFCRRQYWSSPDQDTPTKMDMIVVDDWDMVSRNIAVAQLQTKRMMSFSGGTIKITGNVYHDDQTQWEDDDNNDFIIARVGIGMTYETAKWYSIECSTQGVITHEWSNEQKKVYLVVNGTLKGTGINFRGPFNLSSSIDGISVPYVSVDNTALHGYIFVDIIGGLYDSDLYNYGYPMAKFAIGNLKIEYSRDETYIPSTTSQSTRPRKVAKDRVSSMDYTTLNENAIKNDQNIDLVYASDNNMNFGYGLVMQITYAYMETALYNLTREHPEQHLADRIANFWAAAKRIITADLRTEVVEATDNITPLSHLVLGALHYRTLAINHQWRDDVTTVKMIQSLILLNDEEEE